jgi:RNA-dependent RNA polymerase
MGRSMSTMFSSGSLKATLNLQISIFTDGVGKCAQNICDQAAVALGFPNLRPSAIQIRVGGSKGVLSAWPQIKPREVFLRPSMIKFDAPDQKEIHVVRVSSCLRAP